MRIAEADLNTNWQEVLSLLQTAFAGMAGRIDPPSSLETMTAEDLAETARNGLVLLAYDPGLVGCVFLTPRDKVLYIGKLAVAPERQGLGNGRALMHATKIEAQRRGLPALELQTRIELVENHAAFVAMGFRKTGETAHPGFGRPTSITMRKSIAPEVPDQVRDAEAQA
ncbi:MAG: GNAT family N-acetyltransferase [Pseudomonadota bacterium]